MVEEEVARFKYAYLQMKMNTMKNFITEYRASIEQCDPAGISSAASSVGELQEKFRNESQYLSEKQKEELENLNRDYTNQFQRLYIDRVCECRYKS